MASAVKRSSPSRRSSSSELLSRVNDLLKLHLNVAPFDCLPSEYGVHVPSQGRIYGSGRLDADTGG